MIIFILWRKPTYAFINHSNSKFQKLNFQIPLQKMYLEWIGGEQQYFLNIKSKDHWSLKYSWLLKRFLLIYTDAHFWA